MISPEQEADILRYHHVEKWPVGTISKQLGIHHDAINRVLSQSGIPKAMRSKRRSMIDDYLPFIQQTLTQYPSLCSSRLYAMVKERGYPGGPDHFRHLIAQHRPKPPAEAYLRLKTLPGEESQVDWGHFGKVQMGQASRPLMAFVMVLSYSRRIFLRFYLNQQMENFLRGHEAAFNYFEGLTKVILYDNLKSATLERKGNAIRFNPALLEFAGHYRYEPRPVAVYRGNEKGRVERSIRYIRDNFFAAREYQDLEDLNNQALQWCQGQSSDRPCPEDRSITVRQAYEKEKPYLLPLPDNPCSTDECVATTVAKTPYVRFDLNDYSVPHDYVRKSVTISANLKQVQILNGQQVIATHTRCFDKGQQIEEPQHIEALRQQKKQAKKQSGQDRLIQALPDAQELLTQAAFRGDQLGSMTQTLLRYLDQYGQQACEKAIKEALDKGVPHTNAVRQSLQKQREERQQPPPLAVALPDKPKVRNLVVKPHALNDYDLKPQEEDDDKDQ